MFHEQRSLMQRLFQSLSLTLIVCCDTSASAVTLLEDNREVLIGSDSGLTVINPEVPFEDFFYQSASGQILQSSFVSSEAFSGQGRGGFLSDMGFTSLRSSSFDIAFDVEESIFLELEGILDGQAGDSPGSTGLAFVELYDSNDNLLFSQIGGDSNEVLFYFASVLTPGMYRLVLDLELQPGEFQPSVANWEFQADFTPVPLPATFWLFGIALLGLYRIHSKRN
ncbi:MAG: PEP-CTERM sorting domain-containing protein [Gammaproteobacteria bacterium]